MSFKLCKRCKEVQSTDNFYLRGDSIQGYRSVCKPCYTRIDPKIKQIGRKRRLTDEQRITNTKSAQKKYNATDARKAKQAFYEAARRVQKLNACPKWLSAKDREHIEFIYACAKYFGKLWDVKFHVDHIIPLKGKNVSGLHVPWNLQLMVNTQNCAKGNRLEAES